MIKGIQQNKLIAITFFQIILIGIISTIIISIFSSNVSSQVGDIDEELIGTWTYQEYASGETIEMSFTFDANQKGKISGSSSEDSLLVTFEWYVIQSNHTLVLYNLHSTNSDFDGEGSVFLPYSISFDGTELTIPEFDNMTFTKQPDSVISGQSSYLIIVIIIIIIIVIVLVIIARSISRKRKVNQHIENRPNIVTHPNTNVPYPYSQTQQQEAAKQRIAQLQYSQWQQQEEERVAQLERERLFIIQKEEFEKNRIEQERLKMERLEREREEKERLDNEKVEMERQAAMEHLAKVEELKNLLFSALIVPDHIESNATAEIIVQIHNTTPNEISWINVDFSDLNSDFEVEGTINIERLRANAEVESHVRIKPKYARGTFPVKIKITGNGLIVESEFTIKVGGTEIY